MNIRFSRMFIRTISTILKYLNLLRKGHARHVIVQYRSVFAGKLRHNSGNDILEGNQDMLKEQGTN